KNVSDPVFSQSAEIFRMQKVLVPNLDAVGPALGKLAQELLERLHEFSAMRKVARVKPREFEHEQPNLLAEWLARRDKIRCEQVSVQKILIRLSGPLSEPRQVGELLDRNLVGHLESKQKPWRYLLEHRFKIAVLGKFII